MGFRTLHLPEGRHRWGEWPSLREAARGPPPPQPGQPPDPVTHPARRKATPARHPATTPDKPGNRQRREPTPRSHQQNPKRPGKRPDPGRWIEA
jgi:hypothetical protein